MASSSSPRVAGTPRLGSTPTATWPRLVLLPGQPAPDRADQARRLGLLPDRRDQPRAEVRLQLPHRRRGFDSSAQTGDGQRHRRFVRPRQRRARLRLARPGDQPRDRVHLALGPGHLHHRSPDGQRRLALRPAGRRQQSRRRLAASGFAPNLLPALDFQGNKPDFEFENIVPRLGRDLRSRRRSPDAPTR